MTLFQKQADTGHPPKPLPLKEELSSAYVEQVRQNDSGGTKAIFATRYHKDIGPLVI
jgi:hypothetical protein